MAKDKVEKEDAEKETPPLKIEPVKDGLKEIVVNEAQLAQLQKEAKLVGYYEKDGKRIAIIR